MERKDLEALKLSEEQINGAMKLFNADLEPLKSQLATATQERDSFKSQVSDRDDQIKQLGEQAGNSQKLNDRIAELQKTIKDNDSTAAANLLQVKQDNAVQNYLKDAGVRDVKAVMPFIDSDIVKFDGDKNELTGLEEQIEKLKSDHDYLFTPADSGKDKPGIKATVTGNPNGTPPAADDAFAKALGLHDIKGE